MGRAPAFGRCGWAGGKIQVPRVRGGGWQPTVFAGSQPREEALLATTLEMLVTGVPSIIPAPWEKPTWAVPVSRICQGPDAEVALWRTRSLAATRYLGTANRRLAVHDARGEPC